MLRFLSSLTHDRGMAFIFHRAPKSTRTVTTSAAKTAITKVKKAGVNVTRSHDILTRFGASSPHPSALGEPSPVGFYCCEQFGRLI
jgi:hypothetical protein